MLLTHRLGFVTNSFAERLTIVLFAKALTSIGNAMLPQPEITSTEREEKSKRLRAWESAKGFVIKAAKPGWHVKETFTCSGLERCCSPQQKQKLGNLLWISQQSMSLERVQLTRPSSLERTARSWFNIKAKIAFDMKRILGKAAAASNSIDSCIIVSCWFACHGWKGKRGKTRVARLGVLENGSVHC